ncbi:MAG: sulfite exporter TauE/SafE family protein [Saccharofermentanales bacterium]
MGELAGILDLTLIQLLVVIIAAFLVGFGKTGISGVIMLVIPILAITFGGKDSTGILLPMLMAGDLFAIWYYRKNVNWKNVFAPLPWALAGLILGAVIGNFISDKAFMILIGIIVLLCLGILVYTEKKGKNFSVPDDAWFYILVGILSGFSSMIGNAAGPIFSIYLLALGFKKNNFMGTNAWFFFIINSIKMPLQIFVWHNIGMHTLTITLLLIPVITIGAVLGFLILKKVNEKAFRYLVIGMTTLSAIRLFL